MPGPQVCAKKDVDFPIYRAYNATIESDRTPRTNGNEPNDSAQRKRTTHLDNGIYASGTTDGKRNCKDACDNKNQFWEEKNYDN